MLYRRMVRILLSTIIFSSISFVGLCQDSTSFIKYAYAGSHLVVPSNEHWQFQRAFINGGDSYSIQINKNNFSDHYSAGDTIRLPYYIAEMELLTNKDLVQYQLYFSSKVIE